MQHYKMERPSEKDQIVDTAAGGRGLTVCVGQCFRTSNSLRLSGDDADFHIQTGNVRPLYIPLSLSLSLAPDWTTQTSAPLKVTHLKLDVKVLFSSPVLVSAHRVQK